MAELSAVTCGFALMGFFQLSWFDTDLGPTNPVLVRATTQRSFEARWDPLPAYRMWRAHRACLCPLPQLSTFFALTGVVSIGLLMSATTLTLSALTHLVALGNEATSHAAESKFFERCYGWVQKGGGYDSGEPVPAPSMATMAAGGDGQPLTFQGAWCGDTTPFTPTFILRSRVLLCASPPRSCGRDSVSLSALAPLQRK